MNWEAIGAVGEIVGAIAVIATILYLAVQIRQNTKASRANALQSTTEITAIISSMITADPETTRIWDAGLRSELTDQTDITRFTFLLTQWFVSYESVYLQHQLGTVTDEFFDSRMKAVILLLETPGGLTVWNDVKFLITASFTEYVEAI